MIPNITRGGNTIGLVSYLLGEGRANEHTDQHIIAGTDDIVEPYGGRVLSRDEMVLVGRLLDFDRKANNTRMTGKRTCWDYDNECYRDAGEGDNHVWHVSLSLRPDEPALSDETWAKIARDFVREMGFADPDNLYDANPCRWVAVRHGVTKNGGDHLHLAVNLVRFDGSHTKVWRDYQKAQATANVLEHKYGLEILDSREHGRGSKGIQPAEQAAALREGKDLTDREALEVRVRAALVVATTEAEFLRELRGQDVIFRPRFARGDTNVVVGYSVALRPRSGGEPKWYGGSSLAYDLTLPRMRQNWHDYSHTRREALELWHHTERATRPDRPEHGGNYDRAIADLTVETIERLRALSPGDRVGLANVASDLAGAYAALAFEMGNTHPHIVATARAFGRLAQLKDDPRQHRVSSLAVRNGVRALRASRSFGKHNRGLAIAASMIEISMALSEAVRYQKQRDTALRIIGEISNVQSAWDMHDLSAADEFRAYIAERRSQAAQGQTQSNVGVLERPVVLETDTPIDTVTPQPGADGVSTDGDTRRMTKQEFLATNRFLSVLGSKGKRQGTPTPPPWAGTPPRPRPQPPQGRAR